MTLNLICIVITLSVVAFLVIIWHGGAIDEPKADLALKNAFGFLGRGIAAVYGGVKALFTKAKG